MFCLSTSAMSCRTLLECINDALIEVSYQEVCHAVILFAHHRSDSNDSDPSMAMPSFCGVGGSEAGAGREHRVRLFRKLQLIDDATCDLDLRSPPSNRFEKLRGKLTGRHSIRVNKQWRLVFTWTGERGEAQDIYLDSHDYR